MVTVNTLSNKPGKGHSLIMKVKLREICIKEKAHIIMAMETITRACGKTVSITVKAPRTVSG